MNTNLAKIITDISLMGMFVLNPTPTFPSEFSLWELEKCVPEYYTQKGYENFEAVVPRKTYLEISPTTQKL